MSKHKKQIIKILKRIIVLSYNVEKFLSMMTPNINGRKVN